VVICCGNDHELPFSIKVGELLDKIGSMEVVCLFASLFIYLFIHLFGHIDIWNYSTDEHFSWCLLVCKSVLTSSHIQAMSHIQFQTFLLGDIIN